MLDILFPNWTTFVSILIFLRIYTPTRLYLNNIICSSIAIFFGILSDAPKLDFIPSMNILLHSMLFALFCSFPYWIGGMLGSIMQQMLVLNEQSVQDRRFTEESEALGQISSIIFIMYALQSGFLFRPLIDLFTGNIKTNYELNFEEFYFLLTDSMQSIALVASKYIIVFIVTVICGGYIDLFFKKATLSSTITQNIVPILAVILINLWFLADQYYIYKLLFNKLGY